MVLAWIGFAFSGIFFARYMRSSLQGKKVCGTSWWFQVIYKGPNIIPFISYILILLLTALRGVSRPGADATHFLFPREIGIHYRVLSAKVSKEIIRITPASPDSIMQVFEP